MHAQTERSCGKSALQNDHERAKKVIANEYNPKREQRMHTHDVPHPASVTIRPFPGNALAEHVASWMPDMPGTVKPATKPGIQDP